MPEKSTHILYESPIGLHLFILHDKDVFSIKKFVDNKTKESFYNYSSLATLIRLKSNFLYNYLPEIEIYDYFNDYKISETILSFLEINNVEKIMCDPSFVKQFNENGYKAAILPNWIYRGIKINEDKIFKTIDENILIKTSIQKKFAHEIFIKNKGKLFEKNIDFLHFGIDSHNLNIQRNKMKQNIKNNYKMMSNLKKTELTENNSNFNEILYNIKNVIEENLKENRKYENEQSKKILPRTTKIIGGLEGYKMLNQKKNLFNLSLISNRKIKTVLRKKSMMSTENKKKLDHAIKIDCFRE